MSEDESNGEIEVQGAGQVCETEVQRAESGVETVTGVDGFEPRVLMFCCNWCSYAGADLAGVSRIQYSPHIRIVRVMCSGRIEPRFVLHALEKNIDGVLVTGCHIGDCHYMNGNEFAERRVSRAKELAGMLGLGGERVRLEWISASEGARFAEVVDEFVEELRELGPNPIRKNA